MSAEWRMRPPPTLQGARTCWAAAISSFSRMTKGVTDWETPEDVITYFKGTLPKEINKDRSLKTPRGWRKFAKEFDLKIEEIRLNDPVHGTTTASRGITSIVADDLLPEHFVDKLKRSHVITVIGTRARTGLSHTVLVYGADNLRLCYMNPLSDPALPLTTTRPPGGSGRVAENWFCDTYQDFATGPSYLLIWRG